MTGTGTDVVTGAFSFTGRYIARRLLDVGRDVVTLTNHPDRETPFADEIRVEPYRFEAPAALSSSLEGADTLYNTFWIRDPETGPPPGNAIRYSRRLVEAAEAADVRRIVHCSVSNADTSPLPYYRAKARVEDIVRESAMAHAILRPTLIYGVDDMLVNNLAWALRRFPVFAVFGDGEYGVQPAFVGDVADIAVEQGAGTDDVTIDVAGPDVVSFEAFVRTLVDGLGVRCRIVNAPPRVAYLGVRGLGLLLGDVLLRWDEVRGLMRGLLATDTSPRAETRFEDWVVDHADQLGREYTSYRRRYLSTGTGSPPD